MNVSSLPSLQSLRTQTSAQSSIVIANTQPITDLLAGTNVLSSSQVDSILIALDGNGLLAGTVDLSGQTPPAPPSAVGIARALSLIAKTWTVTLDPSIFIFGDGGGGFWQLIVDISGNVGTQATVGPATSDVILADGVGGFWKVVVDIAGNRGTTPDAGPATLVPALDDGTGVFWKLIVDSTGNLGAQQIVPIAWAPAAETVTWIDTNGTFAGDLSTFRSTADFATVTSLVFGATGNLTSLTGIQELPALDTLNCNTNVLTSLDCSNCTALTTLNCSSNASITTMTLTGCTALVTLVCSNCNITGVLDVTPCATTLSVLDAVSNANMTGINLAGCSTLQELYANDCAIASIDVTPCTGLANALYLANNLLVSIDLTGITNLSDLRLTDNSISTLDVSGIVSLQELYVENNGMTSITFGVGTAIVGLQAANNLMTSLNILNWSAALDIEIKNNSLSSASVSSILCSLDGNGILNGTCDVSGNAAPTPAGLVCSGNLDPGKGWTVTHD